jgi:hypothetical protein
MIMNPLRRVVAPPPPLRTVTLAQHATDDAWNDAAHRVRAYLQALGRVTDDPLALLALERAQQRSDASSAGDPAMAALEELHTLLQEEFARTPVGRRQSQPIDSSAARRLQHGLGPDLDPGVIQAMPPIRRSSMTPERLDRIALAPPPAAKPTRRTWMAFLPRFNFGSKR